jgi:hypothetical protein
MPKLSSKILYSSNFTSGLNTTLHVIMPDLGENANSSDAPTEVGDTERTGQDCRPEPLNVRIEKMPPYDPNRTESRDKVLEGGAAGEEVDDTGLVQLESLCMNCHENVCCLQPYPISYLTDW